jgi:hypothetical protein
MGAATGWRGQGRERRRRGGRITGELDVMDGHDGN